MKIQGILVHCRLQKGSIFKWIVQKIKRKNKARFGNLEAIEFIRIYPVKSISKLRYLHLNYGLKDQYKGI